MRTFFKLFVLLVLTGLLYSNVAAQESFHIKFYQRGVIEDQLLVFAEPDYFDNRQLTDHWGWYLLNPKTKELKRVPVSPYAEQVWRVEDGWLFEIDEARDGRFFGERENYELWYADEAGNETLLVGQAMHNMWFVNAQVFFIDKESNELRHFPYPGSDYSVINMPVREDKLIRPLSIWDVSSSGAEISFIVERASGKKSFCVVEIVTQRNACMNLITGVINDIAVVEGQLYFTWNASRAGGDVVVPYADLQILRYSDLYTLQPGVAGLEPEILLEQKSSEKSLSQVNVFNDTVVVEYTFDSDLVIGEQTETIPGIDVMPFGTGWAFTQVINDPNAILIDYQVALWNNGEIDCLTCNFTIDDVPGAAKG